MNKKIDILSRLGRSIKKYRTAARLSQEKLADIAGFDRTYISLLETGKRNPSLLNLHKTARALNVTIGKLTEDIDGVKANRSAS